MTLGEKIKFLRIKKGLSQEQLANMLSSTKQAIYKYENNIVTNIPLDKIEMISSILDTTPAYLMGWQEQTPTPELSEGERIWLELYKKVSPDLRTTLLMLVERFENLPTNERQMLLSWIRAALDAQAK